MKPMEKYGPGPSDVGTRRYFSLGPFALSKGVLYNDLVKWRHSEGRHAVWVPPPDVMVGKHAGWSLPCIQLWSPYGPPFPRARTLYFSDATEMVKHHGLSNYDALWARVDDAAISVPIVWVDDRPGWEKVPNPGEPP